MSTTNETQPKRRRRGEPRRLLLEAAQELFARQGYNDTSTREIAERAGVSEPLLFRWFGSKAGLFREAVVVPFVEFVDDFNARWQSGFPAHLEDEEIVRQFLGELFDLFRKNRALVMLLWSGSANSSNELYESGIVDEVVAKLRLLTTMRAAGRSPRDEKPRRNDDLATRTTIAMVAGMAVFGEAFYGKRPPSRKAIVDQLTRAARYGHLHR